MYYTLTLKFTWEELLVHSVYCSTKAKMSQACVDHLMKCLMRPTQFQDVSSLLSFGLILAALTMMPYARGTQNKKQRYK